MGPVEAKDNAPRTAHWPQARVVGRERECRCRRPAWAEQAPDLDTARQRQDVRPAMTTTTTTTGKCGCDAKKAIRHRLHFHPIRSRYLDDVAVRLAYPHVVPALVCPP